MKAEIKRVIDSIVSIESPFDPWGTVWDAVTLYAEAVSEGQDAKNIYPDIAEYINECPEVQEIYRNIVDVLEEEKQGQLNVPVSVPTFDLSFLNTKPALNIWRTTAGKIRQLAVEVTLQFKETRLVFEAMPDVLAKYYHQQNANFALRSGELSETDADQLVEWLDVPNTNQNTRIKFFAGPVQAEEGTIIFQVEAMDTSQPVQRAKVMLRDEANHLLESSLTGQDGKVIFKELNAGKYIIQIKQKGMQSEIGISINK